MTFVKLASGKFPPLLEELTESLPARSPLHRMMKEDGSNERGPNGCNHELGFFGVDLDP